MPGREATAVVREESHLDEMREAIRGDFERLERRRGGQGLMHAVPTADAARTDAGEVGAVTRSTEPLRRPWLARLLGR